MYSLPPSHSSFTPQPRIPGAAFWSVRLFRSDQGGVVDVPVGWKGVQLYVVPISIDTVTRISTPPHPSPPIMPSSGHLPPPISVMFHDKVDRSADLLPLASLLILLLLRKLVLGMGTAFIGGVDGIVQRMGYYQPPPPPSLTSLIPIYEGVGG